ncbi:MAG TPA: heavy-metal-associated domain-containing protein [Polyangiaceae bacterium]|nr:heavy-metal-associated domain-containing protein [Polyangiaceae bacterium]
MNCPPRVSRAIASVQGVQSVDVSFADKKAQVTSARCDAAAAKEIADALSEAGYGGEVIETVPSS